MHEDIKRIVVIGDLHGDPIWKKLFLKDRLEGTFASTLYVFVGDYFDSFIYIPQEQIENFDLLIKEKQNNTTNIILLLGNHDYHYLPFVNQRYSGYNSYTQGLIGTTLGRCLDQSLLQISFRYKNIMITHAGVTNTWLQSSKIKFKDIESAFSEHWDHFGFKMNGNVYGDDVYQSPLWVRPLSLKADKIPDYIQIVGHSGVPEIQIEESIVFVDCLNYKKEFLEIPVTSDKSITTECFRKTIVQ